MKINIIYFGKVIILACLMTYLPSTCLAVIDPIREIQKLDSPQPVTMVRVPTAQVAIADYSLIQRDFPEVRLLSPKEIDAWLLLRIGYISKTQLKQTESNSPISIDPTDTKIAFRPAIYGRAVVFDVGTGLIDAKGMGSVKPRQSANFNGLLTTAEAVKEYVYEKLADGIFQHYAMTHPSHITHKTVGIYAVVDWGFDVIYENGTRDHAGILVRQGHDRYGDPHDENYNFLPSDLALEIEGILRSYGVTSAGDSETISFDIADIQGTKNCDLVDFETFFVAKKFTKDLSPITDPDECYEIKTNSPFFVQPDPRISCPFEIWGHRGSYGYHQDPVLLEAKELAHFISVHRLEQDLFRKRARDFIAKFENSMTRKWFR